MSTQDDDLVSDRPASSKSQARLRSRNESREPIAEQKGESWSTTVWPWYKKRYTCSAFPSFEQGQVMTYKVYMTIELPERYASKEMRWTRP